MDKTIDNLHKGLSKSPRILKNPVGWWAALLAGCLLWGLGCEPAQAPPPPPYITYTFDGQTRKIISLLAEESSDNPYREFDQYFNGLYVPASLFAMEPFVLGLSTESRVPTILLVEAHWVKRYGRAGWLHELERSQVKFPIETLIPPMGEAFSISLAENGDRRGRELMAVPTSIRGNVLFYRKDLLGRHQFKPPRDWEELKAICRKILPQEKHLKSGLLLHPIGFINDFFPIFWGFGGQVMDDSRLVLGEPQNQAAFLAAIKEIQGMQGTILPAARDMKQFEPVGAVKQAFFRGEALFMINWNTRRKDLSVWLDREKEKPSGSITAHTQVGLAPIPSPPGRPKRYTNLDSLGWAVNCFAAKSWNALQVMERVKMFLGLLVNEEFQLKAAEAWGEVPSLRSAMEKVKNPEVLQVYKDVFAAPDVEIMMRPHSRDVNNTLEKHLREVLYGQQTPEAALQAVLQELK
jgi:ABC-type glycerol-3-phosphate transport system substrate-binding protein